MTKPIGPVHFKRKQYIVAKKFQLKYVGLILLLMLLTALLCSYTVYYTTMVSLGEKLASVYPQGRLMSIVRAVNGQIVLNIILACPLVALASIFLSHKIAGPMYRMEKHLNGMADGNLADRLTLRKGDEFTAIAACINKVQERFKGTVATERKVFVDMHTELERLAQALERREGDLSAAKESVHRAKSLLISIKEEAEKYKV